MAYHVVATLDAFAVGEVGKLFDEVLTAEVLHELVGICKVAELGAVLVGVVEAEFDDESACDALGVVRGEQGRVLGYEGVGHDASPAIDDAPERGLVLLACLLDGVFVEVFATVVACDEIHVVVVAVSLLVGLLDAAARRGVVAGNGEVDE